MSSETKVPTDEMQHLTVSASLPSALPIYRRYSQGTKPGSSNFALYDLSSRFYPAASPSPHPLESTPTTFHQPQPSRLNPQFSTDHAFIQSPFYDRSSTPLPQTPPSEAAQQQARLVLEKRNEVGPKLVIFMVGLPARGKSYICQKLKRYLSWMGFRTKVFNVGNRRRVAEGEHSADEGDKNHPEKHNVHDAQFFDPRNQNASKQRERLALDSLEELLTWLEQGGKVGILDATNSTSARRRTLLERVKNIPNLNYIFVESICTDPDILAKNVQMKLKSPDYINMEPETALADFRKRMANYERAYEPIGEQEERQGISYIKIINVGTKVTSYNVRGYLASQCVFYLMNIHVKQRFIWLTRHGESEFNLSGRIGGDAHLTEDGKKFARALAIFIEARHPPPKVIMEDGEEVLEHAHPLGIWTSRLVRTIETAECFADYHEIRHLRFLNEIHSGLCEGMTYEEVAERYPEDYKQRQSNKLMGRFPGGENYLDVIERLRPLIIELERMETDVLIITHNVVMRTLLSYFTGMDLMEMTTLDVPLHTVYCLEPKPYGVELQQYRYDIKRDCFEAVGGAGVVSSNSAWTELQLKKQPVELPVSPGKSGITMKITEK